MADRPEDIQLAASVQAVINMALERHYENGGVKLLMVTVCAPMDDPSVAAVISGLPPNLARMLLQTALAAIDRMEWHENPYPGNADGG